MERLSVDVMGRVRVPSTFTASLRVRVRLRVSVMVAIINYHYQYSETILCPYRLAKQSACIALYYRNTTWNVVERTAYI